MTTLPLRGTPNRPVRSLPVAPLGCCWRFQLNIDRIVQAEDIVNGNAEANAAFLATALVQFPSLHRPQHEFETLLKKTTTLEVWAA